MRGTISILSLALLLSCAGPPKATPRVDVTAIEAKWAAAMKESEERLRDDIERDYAPKSAFNLSNSLDRSFRLLDARLTQLEERDRQIEPEELKVLLDPVRASVVEVVTRVDRLESDMNATLEDLFGMREEVRGVLATLEAYRNATRTTLEMQRDVLSRQLRALDEVLAPGVGDGKQSDG